MKKAIISVVLIVPMLVLSQGKAEKKFEYSIELSGTKETVWNAITDITTFSVWDDNVVAVQCPELKKNQNCKVITGPGKIVEVEIVEYQPNESYTVRYKLSSGNMYIQRKFTASDPLALTETVWYKGISKNTFEKYKGTSYQDTLKTRLTRFKTFMDSLAVNEGR